MTKMDPALENELDTVAAAGEAGRRIPVIVELSNRTEARGSLEALEREARQRQAGVLDRLREIGAVDVQPLVLANAIAATLTPEQVRDIASREDVAVVRLARAEHVTT